MTERIYLLLGSNLGNREEVLNKAQNLINKRLGSILKISHIYETAPWGKTNQPAFFNQVIEISSTLKPIAMLAEIHAIENELGRVRQEKWGERKIDIDILYFANQVFKNNDLIIPHPEIQNRRFTLTPLAEIAPDFLHPLLHKSNLDLLTNCGDQLDVKSINSVPNQIK